MITRFTVTPWGLSSELRGVGDLSPSPDLVLSADGRSVAYTAGRAGPGGGSFESLAVPLFVRRLNRLEALQVATVATSPLFSPDGDWMGFFDLSSFKKVPVGGGPAITVGTVPSGGRTAAWGPNDTIVYGRTGRVCSGSILAARRKA